MPTLEETSGPKYLTLANLIKSRIEQGEFKPGDRLPSFTEMRAEFGVTPTTVERVYTQLEQERIIVREHRRGTFVRQPDIRTATGVIGIYGIGFTKNTHFYWGHIMAGLHEVAARQKLELLTLNDESAINWEKVDGIITHELDPPQMEAMLHRIPSKMPCVSILSESRHFACVVEDDYQGGYDLAKHLIQLGHRHIAFLSTESSVTSRRRAGYHDAMREAGIQVEAGWLRELDIIYGGAVGSSINFLKSGALSMQNWLADNWKSLGCTALMAHNDDTAISVIQTLSDAGIRVPEDVSVTGFDGTEIGQYFTPSLTTIEVPLHKIGVVALETLLHQINGDSMTATKMVLPTSLRVGKSTSAIQGS